MKKYIYRIGILILISLFITNLGFLTHTKASNDNKYEDISLNYQDWYQISNRYSINNLELSKIPRDVKGLYVTGNTAESLKYDYLVELLKTTELNSFVIDIKEDSGYITYQSNNLKIKEIGSDRKIYIKDIDDLIHKAKENNIYTIARIVTFKDPFYAGSDPNIALQKKTGGVWRDNKGISWVDPYQREVWEYNIAIAKEIAEKGFDEIQFDYVRFPENGARLNNEVNFNNPDNLSKAEIIADFLKYAQDELKDYSVFISADVFGLTTTVIDDMGIGQQWELITSCVDYISPMMYPSHYGVGLYGITVPDANPYVIIKEGLEDAIEKNNKVSAEGKSVAIIRPWYQDFTASWVPGYIKYGSKEVLSQVNAGKELGITQYLMWNQSNVYSEGAWVNK